MFTCIKPCSCIFQRLVEFNDLVDKQRQLSLGVDEDCCEVAPGEAGPHPDKLVAELHNLEAGEQQLGAGLLDGGAQLGGVAHQGHTHTAVPED